MSDAQSPQASPAVSPLDAAVAFLLRKEAKRQEAKAAKESKEKAPSKLAIRRAAEKAAKEAAKIPSQKPMVIGGLSVGVVAPHPGTLDARSFLAARRAAFSAKGTVQVPFLPSKSRDAQIVAIAAFRGYNPREHFGIQDFQARMEANRQLRNSSDQSSPLYREEKSTARQVKGYVPGMPDNHGKMLRDLKARERLAVEEIAEHARMIQEGQPTFKDEDGSEVSREGLIQLERGRLESIRMELRRF